MKSLNNYIKSEKQSRPHANGNREGAIIATKIRHAAIREERRSQVERIMINQGGIASTKDIYIELDCTPGNANAILRGMSNVEFSHKVGNLFFWKFKSHYGKHNEQTSLQAHKESSRVGK